MSWEKAGKNLHVSASLLRGASVLHAKHWSKPAAELNKPGPAQVGAISKAQKSKNTWKCQKTRKYQTHKKNPLGEKKFSEKKSHNAEKSEMGPFGIFQHPLSQNIRKLKVGPFGEIYFRKKLHNPEKNWKWDTLVSTGIACYD